jgi:hypothetical protein
MKILNEIFDKILVITIPSFTDRIENMKQRLEGVNYEFFYGAYGRDIDVEHYRSKGSRLTRGQLGCALSHYQIYQKMVDENLDNVLILEDDCGFNENVLNLESYYKQLPEDYSVFYLGYDCPFTGPYSSNLNVSTGSVGWTHSMNVRKHCAEKILEINSDLLWTADGAFAQLHNTDGTQYHLAVPQITYQDNDGTTSTLVEVDKQYGMGF